MTRWLRRLGLGIVGLLALGLFARQFFAREYVVNSRSMAPTIRGEGERVLVVFDSGAELERFDLVAIRGDGEGEALVKRVVGLPGEEVLLLRGDLLIDGERLGADAARPPLVPVFDDRHQEVEEWFRMGSYRGNPWSRDGDEWVLEARDVPKGWDRGLMLLQRELRDGYLDRSGEYVPGTVTVHDAALGCRVSLGDPPATLRFLLYDLGDVFEVTVQPRDASTAVVSLTHRFAGNRLPELILPVVPVSWPLGEWREVRFSNVDDLLRFELDGRVVLSHRYDGNVQHPADIREGAERWRSLGHRVAFGGVEGRARFRDLRVWRDLHYVADGEFAVGEVFSLGPDEIFVLGDNSARSHDGREYGPTPLEDVFGRPRAVIWPLDQARWLEGALPPPAAGPVEGGSDR